MATFLKDKLAHIADKVAKDKHTAVITDVPKNSLSSPKSSIMPSAPTSENNESIYPALKGY